MVFPLLHILSNIKTFEKVGWSDAYAAAAISNPGDDPFYQNLNQVKFWAVSTNGDPLSFSVVKIYGGSVSYWNADNNDWETFTSDVSFDSKTIVSLKLDDGDITNGNLTFSGVDPQIDGLYGYNSLAIQWGDSGSAGITITTPQGSFGEVAPVPIPATIWLLGVGLFAIVGIRRKNGE